MSDSNHRKFETLGMPYGTANYKLRKKLIYTLLQILDMYQGKFGYEIDGLDSLRWSFFCIRCGKRIDSEDDMTIEHIKPWEGREGGRDLFWDLGNIGFSHKRCNRPHIYKPRFGPNEKVRKMGPEGTAWCSKHQAFLPSGNFTKNKNRWNGLNHNCRECNRDDWVSSPVKRERERLGRRESNRLRGRDVVW